MENIIKVIKESKSIAILGHESEDADSVGSSLALMTALRNMGKSADVFLSAPLEKRLEFLDTDGLFTEIPEDSYDLCLCVDSGDIQRLGKRYAIFENAKHTLNIDHHATNTFFAEFNLVKADISSAGEIVFDVIECLGAEIDKTIATYLYTAIASDTGSFKYSNVKSETFQKAAKLLEKGIDNAYISKMLFDTEEESVLRFKGYLMNKIVTYFMGKLTVISVSDDEFTKFGVDEKDMSDIVNIARSVKGTEIAVSVRETGGKVKLSFRSNGKYEVDGIAQMFGGGGHKMASGATIVGGEIPEILDKVINYAEELFK